MTSEPEDSYSNATSGALRISPHTLLAQLVTWGIESQTLWHRAVFKVGEGDDIKAELPGAHTKNLFLKDDRDQLWLISAEQSTRIDLKALPKVIGSGRLSFGSEIRLMDALGLKPGSVSALGLIHDRDKAVKFILDRHLAEAAIVNFHPLINEATTTLSQSDFRAFLDRLGREVTVVDFEAMTVIPF